VVTHTFTPIDDASTISLNERMNPPRWGVEGLLWYWRHAHLALYIPLTYMVWGALATATWVPTPDEYGLHLDPRIFHAASLMLHTASAMTVYALLRRLLATHAKCPTDSTSPFPSPGTPGEGQGGGSPWPALAGALLYAVHPLQVEAVAWTSGMKDLLYGLFSLLALLAYVRAVQQSPTNPMRRSAYWLGAACVLLGMLCKPTAMVTPALAAVLDRMILRRTWRDVARTLWPWFIAILPLAVVAKVVQSGQEVLSPPMWQRPVVMGASLAFYLGKLLAPARFTFDYGWEPVVMLRQRWFWAIALIPLALAAALWLGRRRWHWLTAAGAVSVVALIPVLGLVPFQFQRSSTVADHYVYLAMLGPAMAAAWGLRRMPLRYAHPAAAGCAVVLVTLAALTVHQLGYWRTEESILQRNLDLTPHKSIGYNALGIMYQMHNDHPRAQAAYKQAIDLAPDFISPRVSLANIYSFQGRTDDAIQQIEALMDIQQRLPSDQRQDLSGTLIDGAKLMMTRGQYDDAIKYLKADLRHRPNNADATALLAEAQRRRTTSAPAAATTRATGDRL
jgi:hypothetical protein